MQRPHVASHLYQPSQSATAGAQQLGHANMYVRPAGVLRASAPEGSRPAATQEFDARANELPSAATDSGRRLKQLVGSADGSESSGQGFRIQEPAAHPGGDQATAEFGSETPESEVEPRQFYSRNRQKGGRLIDRAPLSTADFIGVDDGSASVRFARSSVFSWPSNRLTLQKTRIPLGIVFSPFADGAPGEAAVPNVQCNEPLRCSACGAYANANFRFHSAGYAFDCNFCGTSVRTPDEHQCVLNPATGQRADFDVRPELWCGTVDYVVSDPSYAAVRDEERDSGRPATRDALESDEKTNGVCHLVFVLEVTTRTVSSGALAVALSATRHALSTWSYLDRCRIAIVSFDASVCFYGFENSRITEYIVPDVDDDPFPAVQTQQCFLSRDIAYDVISSIFDRWCVDTPSVLPIKSCLGSALALVQRTVKSVGGKIFCLVSSTPSCGLGSSVSSIPVTSQSSADALSVESSAFFERLGETLALQYMAVDFFVAAEHGRPFDCASTALCVERSGGKVFYFPSFQFQESGDLLGRAWLRSLSAIRGFDAVLRVRTSRGIKVSHVYGHCYFPVSSELEGYMPVADADMALDVTFSVADRKDAVKEAAIQLAVLYTDIQTGQRRVRVHTILPSVTALPNDLFKTADVDAILSISAKQLAAAVVRKSLSVAQARRSLIDRVVDILHGYRKHCVQDSKSSAGQLILPDSLKVLPLFVLGLMKSSAFREATNVDAAGQLAILHALASFQPAFLLEMAHPRIFLLDELPDWAGLPYPPNPYPVVGSLAAQNAGGVSAPFEEPVAWPRSQKCSSQLLTDENALLVMFTALDFTVYIGGNVSAELLQDCFVTTQDGRVLPRGMYDGMSESGVHDAARAQRITSIFERLFALSPYIRRCVVVQKGERAKVAQFVHPNLIEDRITSTGTWSYMEFLQCIHRRILQKIEEERVSFEFNSHDMLNYGF
ncbi:Protein transport protein Sec24-like CEF [Porphyridium purpureum]|uniref:Protein transport protein Sec24-like CEF n=1 Tax=Porphyridium purpureum TaxID=35688 RepID=A0A5J4Z443_PORPP|nr:Protein transport protein Sec24-like CEF [Porphyridium purpureum]|eukprot:POR9101..scf295_1